MPNVRDGQIIRESVQNTTAHARDGQVIREAIISNTAHVRDGQVIREAILSNVAHARNGQVIREAIILLPPVAVRLEAFDDDTQTPAATFAFQAAIQGVEENTVIWPIPSKRQFPVTFVVT
jgi:hypothetical protein